MEIHIEENSAVPTLTLIGQFWEREDSRRVVAELTALAKGYRGAIVVNLERLTFVGSIGLGSLMKTFSQLREMGCELVLYKPLGNVKEALEIAEFFSIMKWAPGKEELDETLRSIADNPPQRQDPH